MSSYRSGLIKSVSAVHGFVRKITAALPLKKPQASLDGSKPASCVPMVGSAQFPPGPIPDGGLEGWQELRFAPDDIDLPTRVDFRGSKQGFNSRLDVALREGQLFVRLRGESDALLREEPDPWRTINLPKCLTGHVTAMSINEDELVALDASGWIYTMDNLLSSPSSWNWTRSFGAPIWFGPGLQSPTQTEGKWSLSIISTHTDKTFNDEWGRPHPIAFAKVTQVLVLSDDGSRITYLDPWLPADYSYEVGSPLGGRFQSTSISASGSTLFVINKYGDMFTRLFDFDISGADIIFFRYSWQPQDGKPAAPTQAAERLKRRYAAIQLPAPTWRTVPKIPGEITSRISIHSTAAGSDNRELRVEGRHDGQTGYWHKLLTTEQWLFEPTGEELAGQILENTADNRSADTLADPQPYSFQGAIGRGWTIQIPHFDWAVTTRDVTLISPADKRYTVLLHTVDAIRLKPRGVGLDTQPRKFTGAVEITTDALKVHPELGEFKDRHMNGRSIFEIKAQVTTSYFKLSPWKATLLREN